MDDDVATSITLRPTEFGASLSIQLGGACVRQSKLLSEMVTDCSNVTNLMTPFSPSQIAAWMLFCTEHGLREASVAPDTLVNVLKVRTMEALLQPSS